MAYPSPYGQPYGYPSPYGPPGGYLVGAAPPSGYPMGPAPPGAYPAGPAPGAYPMNPAPPGGYPVYPPAPMAPGFYPAPPPYTAAVPSAAPAAPQKSYYLIRSRLNRLVLDIEGASRNPGAHVILWSLKSSDNDNQLWYDDFATGTIRSKMHDFCLDFEGDTLVVKPYNPNNLNQQLERAEPFLRSRLLPDRVLDVAGGNKQPGARVIIYQKHGGLNQCFDVQFIAPQPAAVTSRPQFHIVSEMNCKVLDIKGDNATSGAQVIMFPKKGSKCPNQLWYFDEQGVIRSALNNFALEARTDGAKATMMPFTGDPHQRWMLCGNKIMKNQIECLDIRGGSNKDGADVISWRYQGSANQHWRLEYV